MIDIHSHVIYGIDDGPSTIDQSLKMVKEAERLGIRTIVATPHYHENIFELEHMEENYQELLYKARDYDVAINIGYEVYANPDNQSFMEIHSKINLDKSQITLLEFPYNVNPETVLK